MDYKPTRDFLEVVMNSYTPEQKAAVIIEAFAEFSEEENPNQHMLVQEDVDAIMDSITLEADREIFNNTIEQFNQVKKLIDELGNMAIVILGDISRFENLYMHMQSNIETIDIINNIMENSSVDNQAKKAIKKMVLDSWSELATGDIIPDKATEYSLEFHADEEIEEFIDKLHEDIYEATSLAKSLATIIIPNSFKELNINIKSYENRVNEIINSIKESLDNNSEELNYSYEDIPASDEIENSCESSDCCE